MDNNFNLLEKYILNQLDEENRDIVEKRIENDPLFAEEYKNIKVLLSGIKYNQLINKKNVLKDVESQIQSDRGSGNIFHLFSFGKILLAACLGTILFWVGYRLTDSGNNSTHQTEYVESTETKKDLIPPSTAIKDSTENQDTKKDKTEIIEKGQKTIIGELVQSYKKTAFATLILRSHQSDSMDLKYNSAVTLYNKKQYREVISSFKNTDDQRITYILAHALLNKSQYDAATKLFKELSEDEYFEYQKDAQWYLFLSLLANYPENEKEAKSVADKIRQDKDSTHKEDVNKIIKSMGWQ